METQGSFKSRESRACVEQVVMGREQIAVSSSRGVNLVRQQYCARQSCFQVDVFVMVSRDGEIALMMSGGQIEDGRRNASRAR